MPRRIPSVSSDKLQVILHQFRSSRFPFYFMQVVFMSMTRLQWRTACPILLVLHTLRPYYIQPPVLGHGPINPEVASLAVVNQPNTPGLATYPICTWFEVTWYPRNYLLRMIKPTVWKCFCSLWNHFPLSTWRAMLPRTLKSRSTVGFRASTMTFLNFRPLQRKIIPMLTLHSSCLHVRPERGEENFLERLRRKCRSDDAGPSLMSMHHWLLNVLACDDTNDGGKGLEGIFAAWALH